MPTLLPVYLYSVEVTFLPQNIGTQTPLFSLAGDITTEFEGQVGNFIEVGQGIGIINFVLNQTADPETGFLPEFPTNPVGWFNSTENNQVPQLQAACFQVLWYNPYRFTILDFNSVLAPIWELHPFNIIVAYEGQTYGSDPVIVNMPPDG